MEKFDSSKKMDKMINWDIWLSRTSNIITILMFIIQIPKLNKLFINTFEGTSIAFKLLISVVLIFTTSYSLNRQAFKVDKVFLSVFSTLFLINITFMFIENIIPLKIMLVTYILYFFSDWLGLKAAYFDCDNVKYFEWMQITKFITYIIFIFVLYYYYQ